MALEIEVPGGDVPTGGDEELPVVQIHLSCARERFGRPSQDSSEK